MVQKNAIGKNII